MAEFAEVMKQWHRMCKSQHNDCTDCDIWTKTLRADFCFCNKDTCSEEAIKAVEIIAMQWAEEHPEPVYPTWGEWFENYMCETEAPIDTSKSVTVWMYQTPISADIAQKLGLKPKEENT